MAVRGSSKPVTTIRPPSSPPSDRPDPRVLRGREDLPVRVARQDQAVRQAREGRSFV